MRNLLLTDPTSSDRLARLSAVESRVMPRVWVAFKMRSDDRALAMLSGGLLLINPGELKADTLGREGVPAIREAAHELATRGDEGGARGAYEILLKLGSAEEKAEAERHLAAIADWTRDGLAAAGPVAKAGILQRVAVRRFLIEPTEAAATAAMTRTIEWIQSALTLRNDYATTHAPPAREDAAEAFRAFRNGPISIAAIAMRSGDAAGALDAIKKSGAAQLAPSGLLEVLHRLAAMKTGSDTDVQVELLRAFVTAVSTPPAPDEPAVDAREDENLLRAAIFRVAADAYRRDPTRPEVAGTLAAALQRFDFIDASPTVLVASVLAMPEPRVVGSALGVTAQGIVTSAEAGDIESARRTYEEAAPILKVADALATRSELRPSAARLRALMGEMEMREGRLDSAEALFKESVDAEKSGVVMLSLARIKAHRGKNEDAAELLRAAVVADDSTRDAVLRGEVLLVSSDVAMQLGDAAAAKTLATLALQTVAAARQNARTSDKARVERTLARVLDRFNEKKRAHSALERAFQAAPRDREQVGATVGQMVSRAVVQDDLTAAHDGLLRALAADISAEDALYFALWVRYLEEYLQKPTDGKADRVFAAIHDDGRWSGRLAAFGAHKISGDDLIASAKTPAQKTEALFYAALRKRTAREGAESVELLKQVMASDGLDMMELGMARELLAGKAMFDGGLPRGASVPE